MIHGGNLLEWGKPVCDYTDRLTNGNLSPQSPLVIFHSFHCIFFIFLHIFLLHFKHPIVFSIKCLPIPWVTCVIEYTTPLLDI